MNILYATDGSEGSHEAAQFLGALAPRQDNRIHILTVPTGSLEEEHKAACLALTQARLELGPVPGCVTTEIARPATSTGEIAERIVERAGILPADLVVIGTQGHSALTRWLVGSVALSVTRHAPCPVLIARSPRGKIDRVVAGVDGSECAAAAVRWMLKRLPLPDSCAIRLLGIAALPALVWGEPALGGIPAVEQTALLLDQEQERLEEALSCLAGEVEGAADSVTTEIRSGSVAGGLMEAAKEQEADLLTVGSHGFSGVERWLLGSVSEAVLQRSPCSVLIVRQPRSTPDGTAAYLRGSLSSRMAAL